VCTTISHAKKLANFGSSPTQSTKVTNPCARVCDESLWTFVVFVRQFALRTHVFFFGSVNEHRSRTTRYVATGIRVKGESISSWTSRGVWFGVSFLDARRRIRFVIFRHFLFSRCESSDTGTDFNETSHFPGFVVTYRLRIFAIFIFFWLSKLVMSIVAFVLVGAFCSEILWGGNRLLRCDVKFVFVRGFFRLDFRLFFNRSLWPPSLRHRSNEDGLRRWVSN